MLVGPTHLPAGGNVLHRLSADRVVFISIICLNRWLFNALVERGQAATAIREGGLAGVAT